MFIATLSAGWEVSKLSCVSAFLMVENMSGVEIMARDTNRVVVMLSMMASVNSSCPKPSESSSWKPATTARTSGRQSESVGKGFSGCSRGIWIATGSGGSLTDVCVPSSSPDASKATAASNGLFWSAIMGRGSCVAGGMCGRQEKRWWENFVRGTKNRGGAGRCEEDECENLSYRAI